MSGGVLQLQLVQGTPIGIKFATGRAATPETPEQLSGPAGAPGAVVNNWNNVIVADNAGVVTAPPAAAGSSSIPFALTDGNNAATSVSLAHYAGSNTYSVYNATQGGSGGIGTGIQQLMNSYIDNNAGTGGTANPAVAGLSGLNYVKYDIYVYFGSDGNGRSGALNLFTGSTDETGTLAGTFYYSTDANHGAATAYELTTDSTAATYPNADYAIFTGQTASSFAVDTVSRRNGDQSHRDFCRGSRPLCRRVVRKLRHRQRQRDDRRHRPLVGDSLGSRDDGQQCWRLDCALSHRHGRRRRHGLFVGHALGHRPDRQQFVLHAERR